MNLLDLMRAARAADINSITVPEDVKTWDTAELQKEFEVLGFAAPYVVVVRKADGVRGSLEFKHSPRVYFNWQEDK